MILTLLIHTIENFKFSDIEKKVALYSGFSVLLYIFHCKVFSCLVNENFSFIKKKKKEISKGHCNKKSFFLFPGILKRFVIVIYVISTFSFTKQIIWMEILQCIIKDLYILEANRDT